MNLNKTEAKDFEELVGLSFEVSEIDGCELRLEQVDTLAKYDESAREPFALVFKGEHAEPLAQGMFELRHADAGELQIFIVPVGPTEGGFLYEAVFN